MMQHRRANISAKRSVIIHQLIILAEKNASMTQCLFHNRKLVQSVQPNPIRIYISVMLTHTILLVRVRRVGVHLVRRIFSTYG
jgi:hypothetical protein